MSGIRKIVDGLNHKLFTESKLNEQDYFQFLEFVETPTGDYIKYMGNYLWDSENDYREWISDDEQESVESYLYREMLKISTIIKDALKIAGKSL